MIQIISDEGLPMDSRGRAMRVPHQLKHGTKAPGQVLADLLGIWGRADTVAARLGVHPSTVYRWLQRWDIKSERL